MSEYSAHSNSRFQINLNNPIWQGKGGFWKGLFQIAWTLLRFWLSKQLWGTAVRLAHFPLPTKTLGIVVAIITIALFAWGIWGLWQALITLGIRRLLVTVFVVYLLFLAVNVLTIPDDRPIITRFFSQMGQTAVSFGNTAVSAVKEIIAAPDEFLFAYTGERKLPELPPGFPTPDPQATSIVVSSASGGSSRSLRPTPTATMAPKEDEETAVPTNPANIPQPMEETAVSPNTTPIPQSTPETPDFIPSANLEIGGYAVVINTGSQALQARAEPGTEHDVVTKFEAGTRLLILDGPQVAGDYTWWQVRGESGEGWCADNWLQPVEN